MRNILIVIVGLLWLAAGEASSQAFEQQALQISQEMSDAALKMRQNIAASQAQQGSVSALNPEEIPTQQTNRYVPLEAKDSARVLIPQQGFLNFLGPGYRERKKKAHSDAESEAFDRVKRELNSLCRQRNGDLGSDLTFWVIKSELRDAKPGYWGYWEVYAKASGTCILRVQ